MNTAARTAAANAATSAAPVTPLPKLIKLDALAAHLGMSRSNAYRLVREGQLRARKIGKIWYLTETDARAFCGEPV